MPSVPLWLSVEVLSLFLATVALGVAGFALYTSRSRAPSRSASTGYPRGRDARMQKDVERLADELEKLKNLVAPLLATPRGGTPHASHWHPQGVESAGAASGSDVAEPPPPPEESSPPAPAVSETPHPPPLPEERPWTFSPEGVSEIYRSWCRTGEHPEARGSLEVVPLRYAKNEPREFEQPRPLFKDAQQVAEFVRFTPTGGSDGYLYPHPQASFKPVHQLIFHLNEAAFSDGGREAMAATEPLRIIRRSDGLWEQP